jgi:hypothetical protein
VLLALVAMLIGLVLAMSPGWAQPSLSAERALGSGRASATAPAARRPSRRAQGAARAAGKPTGAAKSARSAEGTPQAKAKPSASRNPGRKLPGLPEGMSSSSRRPRAASSLYMTSVSSKGASRLGCTEAANLRGTGADAALVVLDFGRPAKASWRLGVSLFGYGFRSVGQVRDAGVAYARSYAKCLGHHDGPKLFVALGTSNYGSGVRYAHGRAWALMVNAANDMVASSGIADRVEIAGADDIETGWGGPAPTRAWVRGYDSVAQHAYYDYGDAGGCPPAGSCLGRWTLEDLWYVSWGARAAWPLPEIYTPNGTQAQQWAQLSLYAARRHGSPMTIVGALSQQRACKQSSDPCTGMNASPNRAWRILRSALGRNRRTRQELSFSTDIRWTGR